MLYFIQIKNKNENITFPLSSIIKISKNNREHFLFIMDAESNQLIQVQINNKDFFNIINIANIPENLSKPLIINSNDIKKRKINSGLIGFELNL